MSSSLGVGDMYLRSLESGFNVLKRSSFLSSLVVWGVATSDTGEWEIDGASRSSLLMNCWFSRGSLCDMKWSFGCNGVLIVRECRLNMS